MKLSHALSNLVLVGSKHPPNQVCRSQKSKIVSKHVVRIAMTYTLARYIGLETKRRLHDRKKALTFNIYTSAVADHTIKTGQVGPF